MNGADTFPSNFKTTKIFKHSAVFFQERQLGQVLEIHHYSTHALKPLPTRHLDNVRAYMLTHNSDRLSTLFVFPLSQITLFFLFHLCQGRQPISCSLSRTFVLPQCYKVLV